MSSTQQAHHALPPPTSILRSNVRAAFLLLAGLMVTGTVSAATDTQSKATAEPVVLNEITVTSSTASGQQIRLQNAPASISVVTQEELQGKAYRDVQSALRGVPGVYLNTSPTGKGGTGEIRIRGLDAKYTLVMVDGVPQGSAQAYYNGFGQGAEFGWLPPVSAIQRIEVIRGPMSTIYGSAALGGVINIITKPVANEPTGTVSLSRVFQENSDSGDQYQGNFQLSTPLIKDTLSLSLNGGFLRRQEDQIASGYAGYWRRNANIGLDWVVNDNNTLGLELGFGRQDTDVSANKSSSRGSDMGLVTERQRQRISHQLDWNGNWMTSSYLQHEKVKQDSGNQSIYERTTVNSQTVIPWGRHQLTLGTRYRVQETQNPERGLGHQHLERWDAAVFAEDEWFVSRKFTATFGLRYVHDEHYKGELVPRIYGVYRLNHKLSLKGGVSAGYRTPDLKQGDSYWLEGGCGPRISNCRDVGNSNLEPEKSTAYELGLYYLASNGFSSNITIFHTEFTNKIGKEQLCESANTSLASCKYLGNYYYAVNQYINIGEAEINGVELAFSAPLMPRLTLDGSYTYTDSERKTGDNAGEPLSGQPEHLATLGVNWRSNDDTSFWANLRAQSHTLQTPGRRGTTPEYPGYAMVDAGVNYQLGSRWNLYAGVYNVLDKEIDEETFDRVLDGRRYSLGIRVNL